MLNGSVPKIILAAQVSTWNAIAAKELFTSGCAIGHTTAEFPLLQLLFALRIAAKFVEHAV